jgi:hypothetical protein
MQTNVNDFNKITPQEYNLIENILKLYKNNKKLIAGFNKNYKKDIEFANIIEKENNNTLGGALKKEQNRDEIIIESLIKTIHTNLEEFNKLNLQQKIQKAGNIDLLKKNKKNRNYNINKIINTQLIDLGIEYYKRKYLNYKLKYLFNI